MALFTKHEIGVQVTQAFLYGNVVDGFAFVLLMAFANVSNLDVLEAEAKQTAGGFNQGGQLNAIQRLLALFGAHALVPRRKHYGNNGHAQAFVINVKHGVHTVGAQLVHDLHKFVLVLEGAGADEDGVGVLQFQVCAFGNFH